MGISPLPTAYAVGYCCYTPKGCLCHAPERGNTIVAHCVSGGLLFLHPEGVSLSCPGRGNTIVAHCVSGGYRTLSSPGGAAQILTSGGIIEVP